VGLLSYPLYTNFYQGRVQNRLSHQFASPELKDAYKNHKAQVGDALTRIKIPKINVDVVVVEGTTASALRAGAGHYPESPLPCEDGNVAIAGHRTTYGKPFADIDQLQKGDVITLETPIGSCTYSVDGDPIITPATGRLPNGRSVVDNTPGQRKLTLTSCHPKGSAKERIVAQATLVKGQSASA
jgi:sortase A